MVDRPGFCEHYAEAFTYAMRAAGVPARVVGGYMGGEPGMGDYLIVRAADAHAWSEVWIEGQGWVRVDPTAAVAPARVESGLDESLDSGEPVPLLAQSGGGVWLRVNLAWDALQMRWNRYFLGYGPDTQNRFLAGLGLPSRYAMVAVLATVLILIIASLVAWTVWAGRARGTRDPVVAAWQRVCRRWAAAGLPRPDWEPPNQFAERVAAQRPEWGPAMRRLADLYCRIRYAGQDSPVYRRALRRQALLIRPRRRRSA